MKRAECSALARNGGLAPRSQVGGQRARAEVRTVDETRGAGPLPRLDDRVQLGALPPVVHLPVQRLDVRRAYGHLRVVCGERCCARSLIGSRLPPLQRVPCSGGWGLAGVLGAASERLLRVASGGRGRCLWRMRN